MAKLIVLNGSEGGTVIGLGQAAVTIGRSMDCDLQLGDKLCSRKHCSISKKSKGYIIEDLGSSHGVAVNGRKIKKTESLSSPCKILAGGTLLLFCNSEHDVDLPSPEDAAQEANRLFQRLKAEEEKLKLYKKEHKASKVKRKKQRTPSPEQTARQLAMVKYVILTISLIAALYLVIFSETTTMRFLAMPFLLVIVGIAKTLKKK